jgi:hypothetical protein
MNLRETECEGACLNQVSQNRVDLRAFLSMVEKAKVKKAMGFFC